MEPVKPMKPLKEPLRWLADPPLQLSYNQVVAPLLLEVAHQVERKFLGLEPGPIRLVPPCDPPSQAQPE